MSEHVGDYETGECSCGWAWATWSDREELEAEPALALHVTIERLCDE